MNLGRFTLIFAAIAFLGYSGAFLIFPTLMVSLVGIELPIPSAVIDVRATYGGSSLGMAVFFAWCSSQNELLRSGLIAQAAVLGGFIFGRIIGLVVDREPNLFIYILLIAEILGLALALIALRIDVKSTQELERSV